jgi:hypothetical protein
VTAIKVAADGPLMSESVESDIRVRLGRAPTVTVAVTVTVTVTRLAGAGTVPLRGNRRAGPVTSESDAAGSGG